MLIKKHMQISVGGNNQRVRIGDDVHILNVTNEIVFPHHAKFIGEVGVVRELFPETGVIVDFGTGEKDRGWLFLFGEFKKVRKEKQQ